MHPSYMAFALQEYIFNETSPIIRSSFIDIKAAKTNNHQAKNTL